MRPMSRTRTSRPSRATLEQHVAELGGVGESSEQLDARLECPLLRRGRTIQHAAGHLHVLPPERLDDLAGGHAERCDALRIEPDAHGIFARAEQADVADAIEPDQPVPDVLQRVVRQIQLVARVVGRVDVHDHQDVGRVLRGDDTEPAHVFGQARQRNVDAVLHEHLRLVEIGPEREGGGDGDATIGRGLRGDVQHPLHTVDFLFEGRRHGCRDRFRIGSGVGRRHGDARWSDFRVLRYGKAEVRHGANQHDQHGDHAGENRAIDEQLGEAHGLLASCRPGARRGHRSERPARQGARAACR